MVSMRQRIMHWLHDRLCPCDDSIGSLWECSDCGLLNEARYDWCQDPSCAGIGGVS